MQLHAHADVASWAAAAAADIVDGLQADLQRRGQARLLVSGGSTPGPVYRAVARQSLPWSLIRIGLVDERWLAPGAADSNAFLVHESLLVDHAASAIFQPLLLAGRNLDASVLAANREFQPASVLVLGMGPDGHTASLFPHMSGLDRALAADTAYVAVDAGGCPGAGPWPQRISLTPAGMAPSRKRILLIRGEHKRKVLEQAAQGAEPGNLPIALTLALAGAALQVHWCP